MKATLVCWGGVLLIIPIIVLGDQFKQLEPKPNTFSNSDSLYIFLHAL